MSFLSSNSKPPKQIIIEEEGEVAEEIWNLIEGEEADIEKIRQIEKNNPEERTVKRAENALESLAVTIDEDLNEIANQEEEVERQLRQVEIHSPPEGWNKQMSFTKAAEHNLKLVEKVTEILFEENSNFETWLRNVEHEEDTAEEIEDLLSIEQKVKEDLEKSAAIMRDGGKQFQHGWIDLS